jgi:hypothetical protein
MARLQSGSTGGTILDGVIPIKYRRVPCPVAVKSMAWVTTRH